MRQFRVFLGIVALFLTVPLIPVLGHASAWVIAGFLVLDFLLLYGMMQLTYRSGRVRETVTIWSDRMRIERVEPSGRCLEWEANPYWVRVEVVDTKRVPSYLMLCSSDRQVELGAFLTADERIELADELRGALNRAAGAANPL